MIGAAPSTTGARRPPARLAKGSIDVGIVVDDLATSEHFYRDVLGFEHVDDLTHVPGMVIRRFAAGDSLIKLVEIDPRPGATNPPGGAPGGRGLRYLTLYVDDVDHVVYRCIDGGIDVPQPPTETRPGVVVAKVVDPDGCWWEIISRDRPAPVASDADRPLPAGISGVELCWGSIGRTPVSEYFTAAAEAGWTAVTLRPSHVRASVEAGADVEQLAGLAADLGLVVTTVDSLSSALPGSPDPSDRPPSERLLFAMTEDDCFAIAEAFGAPRVQVTNFRGSGADRAEMVDALGRLTDRAADRGLDLVLEFIPASGIPDLATAVDLVTSTGRANVTVMVDTWHLARSGGTSDDLRRVPAGVIGGLQVSDCPLEPAVMARTAFPAGGEYVPGSGRLLPGEGHLDLAEIISAATSSTHPIPVGIEVFNAGLRGLPTVRAAGLARRALEREILGMVPTPPA